MKVTSAITQHGYEEREMIITGGGSSNIGVQDIGGGSGGITQHGDDMPID